MRKSIPFLCLVIITLSLTQGCTIFSSHRRTEGFFFPKYTSNYKPQIKIDENLKITENDKDTIIILDSFTVTYSSTNSAYLDLFRKGYISSDVFKQLSCSKMNKNFRVRYFHEIERIGKRRRFSFWVYDNCFIGPVAFYLELRNSEIKKDADLKSFIEGSELIFLSFPYPQI